jgi:serine/threonine protein kinase
MGKKSRTRAKRQQTSKNSESLPSESSKPTSINTFPESTHLTANSFPAAKIDWSIPEYTILKRIGAGAYGEVWLARSVTGAYRAIKLVWRVDFEDDINFQREFLGIQHFEPISRYHNNLVNILHVGWNQDRGFYYCVMELADDLDTGTRLDNPETYEPRTFSSDIKRHYKLNLNLCIDYCANLADALHFMHNQGLIHRDIKPANIIYCSGVCKLADIGLVTSHGQLSFVGTEGYIPPEGLGTAQADIYSLGKVLYEISTGKDRLEFPEWPENMSAEELPIWRELNDVLCTACNPNTSERYSTAAHFAEALRLIGKPKPEATSRQYTRYFLNFIFSLFILSWIFYIQQQAPPQYSWPIPQKTKITTPIQPITGKAWKNSIGLEFIEVNQVFTASTPVSSKEFDIYIDEVKEATEFEITPIVDVNNLITSIIVILPEAQANYFCQWLTHKEHQSQNLPEHLEYSWISVPIPKYASRRSITEKWHGLQLTIVPTTHGKIQFHSQPIEAEIYQDNLLIAKTPYLIDRIKAGPFRFELRAEGFTTQVITGELKPNEQLFFKTKLQSTGAVVFGLPWTNSLNMKFNPVHDIMVATTETTIAQYQQYKNIIANIPITQPNLPITLINYEEANQFCEWLTQQERQKNLLQEHELYRLPTDLEWSQCAELPLEIGETPVERNLRIRGFYPWGFNQEPPIKFANYNYFIINKKITRLDTFSHKSPVASFKPNKYGLHDIGGNVWEMVLDPWDNTTPSYSVLRGGAYTTENQFQKLLSYRKKMNPKHRFLDVGFRPIITRQHQPKK